MSTLMRYSRMEMANVTAWLENRWQENLHVQRSETQLLFRLPVGHNVLLAVFLLKYREVHLELLNFSIKNSGQATEFS